MARAGKTGPSAAVRDRLTRFRAEMKRNKVRAFLITKHMDLFYLTGFTGEDSAGLITENEVNLISDGRFEEAIRQECPWARVWMRKGLLIPEIASVCEKLKLRSVAIQADEMTVAARAELEELNSGTKLTVGPAITGQMRRIKDAEEMKVVNRAIRIAEDAFLAMRKDIRVGQTELEMAARLEYEMKCRGASGTSFTTIVAEGPNSALPHAHPGRRKVREGSAILFDWGARYGMYCSDLTRMVFVGRVPPKFARIYPLVLEAKDRSTAAIAPGRKMCDVDEVARSFIREAGFEKEFNHGLGHGVGLDIHEPPSLSWRSDEPLAAGMVVTVEPGIYLPGVGGVRIEDDVLVTGRGRRRLSRLSTALEDAIL